MGIVAIKTSCLRNYYYKYTINFPYECMHRERNFGKQAGVCWKNVKSVMLPTICLLMSRIFSIKLYLPTVCLSCPGMSNLCFILHPTLHWLYLSPHIHREAGLVQVIQILGCDRVGTVLASLLRLCNISFNVHMFATKK